MIETDVMEISVRVVVSGVLATVVAMLVGVVAGGLSARSRSGRIMGGIASGLTRVVIPAAVGVGGFLAVMEVGIGITVTPAVVGVVQLVFGLIVAAGSTAHSIRLLPPDATEQLDALRLGRAQSARISIVEVWPQVVGGGLMVIAHVVAIAGAFLIGGGRLGSETRIASPIIVDAIGSRPEVAAGLLLVCLSGFVAIVLFALRWLR